jgi:hypothetical protein
VTAGKVEPNGELVFTFGKPASRTLGPGTPVQSTAFVVQADAAGIHAQERAVGKAVSLAEPNCIFEDLVDKIAKTGIPNDQRLHLRYARSDKGTRGVWRASPVGEARTLRMLDGATCAIIVH